MAERPVIDTAVLSRRRAARLAELEIQLEEAVAEINVITREYRRELGLISEPKMPRQPTLGDVCREVSDFYNVTQGELTGRKRGGNVGKARLVAMYLCRMLCIRSFQEIANHFGRDHGTIMSACDRVAGLMDVEPRTRTEVASIRQAIVGE